MQEDKRILSANLKLTEVAELLKGKNIAGFWVVTLLTCLNDLR